MKLKVCVMAAIVTIAATAAASARQAPQADPRPANNPEQKPAFAGQTDAPEQKLGVAFEVVTVVEGLQNPWSVAFLPNGKMLITERPGRLRVLGTDGKLSEPVAGLPAVFARSQQRRVHVVFLGPRGCLSPHHKPGLKKTNAARYRPASAAARGARGSARSPARAAPRNSRPSAP